jgi:hypothetical protein
MPAFLVSLLLILASAMAAQAQATGKPQAKRDWPTEKCERYKTAFAEALARQGKQGLGQEFLTRHEAFIASNCTAQPDVCARSKEELALANTLVILAMNRGMSSTFVPFYCRS